MKIPAIDQGDIDWSALEPLRGVQPREAASQDQNAVSFSHRQRPFFSNPPSVRIISFLVRVLRLIHPRRVSMRQFRPVAMAVVVFLFPVLCAFADGSNGKTGAPSAATAESEPVSGGSAPTIVIGFLGGFVRHDDAVHSTVQVAQSLQKDYRTGVRIQTFENRRVAEAHEMILRVLAQGHKGGPTADQKRAARVILYGHSWGASTVVALARRLKVDGIPVVLTIQVDSVAKGGQNDSIIPDNVSLAANFYQDKGFVRGQEKISAEDASRTHILGNFRMDYSSNPISCPEYPWYTRFFMRSHIEIECDQHVWQRVEGLIRQQLPTAEARSTNTP
jgi:hypothetical protein